MSFILDALKKSEVERQRQTLPGLTDTRLGVRRNGLPLWAVALGVLFAVNLLVLGIILWRKSPSAGHVSTPVDSPSAAAAAAKPPAQHFSPLDSAPVYAPEIPVAAQENGASPQAPRAVANPPEVTNAATLHTVHRPDPVSTGEDANAGDQEVLPSISEINLTGAQALPELHLDVHVYATKAAERFVYINMRKYHEGSKLQEGPTLERIRRDGVVLNYQGLRFILPRQP